MLGQAAAEVFRGAGWDIEGWTLSAESAQKFAGVDLSNSRGRHQQRRSSCGTLPADLIGSSIVRARAEATPKIIVASISKEQRNFSATFLTVSIVFYEQHERLRADRRRMG